VTNPASAKRLALGRGFLRSYQSQQKTRNGGGRYGPSDVNTSGIREPLVLRFEPASQILGSMLGVAEPQAEEFRVQVGVAPSQGHNSL
jgi:hypothetical protein